MLEAEARRRSVLRLYPTVGEDVPRNGGDDVFSEVFAPSALHHLSSPSIGDGPESTGDGPDGARRIHHDLQSRLPGVVATVKRTASDGEFVAVHWHASTDPGDEFSGESWCEFFRFDGDQVVEHWQLSVDVPSSTISGRSVFSDAFPRESRSDADAAATAVNREIASAAFARFIAFDHTVLDEHWGDVYLQHNEMIPDGLAAIRDSLAEVGGLPEEVRPRFTVLATVADGDLVWFLEEVHVGDLTGFGADIFRLVDRRIVEHWDVPALRPAPIEEPA